MRPNPPLARLPHSYIDPNWLSADPSTYPRKISVRTTRATAVPIFQDISLQTSGRRFSSCAWQTLRKCHFDSFVIVAQTYVTFQTHDLRKAIPMVGTPRQSCAANGSTKCSQSESRILNAPNAVR